MTHALLAAIRFDTGNIDGFLRGIADMLSNGGLRVRGALQSRGMTGGTCRCADMDRTTLGSGVTDGIRTIERNTR